MWNVRKQNHWTSIVKEQRSETRNKNRTEEEKSKTAPYTDHTNNEMTTHQIHKTDSTEEKEKS